MFKQLKRKIVLINMITLSVVMLISFATIHCITYFNIQSQNKLRMESIVASTQRLMELSQNSGVISTQVFGEYLHGFGIVVDEAGQVVFDSSFGTIPSSNLEEVIGDIKKENKESGEVTLCGEKYKYMVSVVAATVKFDDSDTNINPKIESLYQFSFLNITDSNNTLVQLLVTFVIVGLTTLIIIFCISLYFAKQSTLPIEQSYSKQKQFIQDASHELKTPLATIRANLDAVNSNPEETVAMQKKWLSFISLEVERMTKLVCDLLYLARSEYGQSPTNNTKVDLSKLVDSTSASVEAVAFEKGIVFEIEKQADIFIIGDEEKILQVIKILFDNAIKYNKVSGVVRIQLTQDKSNVFLCVSNTGEGIAKEHIPKIFDRFYRVDESREHDGSYGLGLSIAKNIIENMSGEITVHSILGEQTTFTVKFKK
ncbi:sensor histidine kinase [Vallitalea maricola]|uniref:HAMP domain-containing sensor histidine kinase n=1 Tax=Vallitalea maricola TaxID=3074433 RepID=A0ACB5UFW4_9FIRM|nr:HAMP domain-containing sensor histidine kinase [Vallitalea sp. AN17-2]